MLQPAGLAVYGRPMSQRLRPDRDERPLGTCKPPEGHRRQPLFRGLGVGIDDFRCCAHVEPEGDEEPNPTHSIVFVRRGVFVRRDRDETMVADANHILFFNQGQPYRYAHPLPGGDDCTIFMLDDECARAAVSRVAPRDAEHPRTPFRFGHARSTARIARLHFELLVLSRGGNGSSSLSREDLVAELIDASLEAAHAGNTGRIERESAAGARRRRDAVEAVKLILNERFESPPRLAELAASVNCSPFHLSRIFRVVTGLTLRRYLQRLRAQLASDRLARGPTDLTALALDLGFFDHSHFTNAFRREWGVPPSRLLGDRHVRAAVPRIATDR